MEEWLALEDGSFVLIASGEVRYDCNRKQILSQGDMELLYGTQASEYWNKATRLILNTPLEYGVKYSCRAMNAWGYSKSIDFAHYHVRWW